MSQGNPFNLPLLGDPYSVEPTSYIRLVLDSDTKLYSITYPSGLFRRDLLNHELAKELARYVADPERVEQIIRYTTEWRRVNFYPDTDMMTPVFPNGQEYRGGAGNHNTFGRDFIWNREDD
jgi:hypothetical protein